MVGESMKHPLLVGIFAVSVFRDGVRAEDLGAAIQAAWLAGDRELAKELAERYGLYNQICLCCASAYIAPVASVTALWWAYQLCASCHWRETRPFVGLVKLEPIEPNETPE